jgi:hypothetical protein
LEDVEELHVLSEEGVDFLADIDVLREDRDKASFGEFVMPTSKVRSCI